LLISQKFLIKITEKWPVKILSVAAALILFVFYKMNTLESRSFSVPLQVENANELVPASLFAQTVRVSLRGEANSIFPIQEGDIEAYIDLGKYSSEGTYRIAVHTRKKGSALGVEPLEVSADPTEVHLMLEKKLRQDISVTPVFRGSVAEGYELTAYSITPEAITAEGPGSIMETIKEFKTATIDLEGRYEDFNVIINILNNEPLVEIQGNRMIEYKGTIRAIRRGQRQIMPVVTENTDIYHNSEEEQHQGEEQ
jgi:YbbR domain-containing protein